MQESESKNEKYCGQGYEFVSGAPEKLVFVLHDFALSECASKTLTPVLPPVRNCQPTKRRSAIRVSHENPARVRVCAAELEAWTTLGRKRPKGLVLVEYERVCGEAGIT
jgi:hypothetical protein